MRGCYGYLCHASLMGHLSDRTFVKLHGQMFILLILAHQNITTVGVCPLVQEVPRIPGVTSYPKYP